MKVYTSSQARQKLAELLDLARAEDVVIQRRGGETFVLRYEPGNASPLDIPALKTKARTKDILSVVKEGREWPRRRGA